MTDISGLKHVIQGDVGKEIVLRVDLQKGDDYFNRFSDYSGHWKYL